MLGDSTRKAGAPTSWGKTEESRGHVRTFFAEGDAGEECHTSKGSRKVATEIKNLEQLSVSRKIICSRCSQYSHLFTHSVGQ